MAFNLQVFRDAARKHARNRLFFTDDQRERLTRMLGTSLSAEDVDILDGNRNYSTLVSQRTIAILKELSEAGYDETGAPDPDTVSFTTQAFYEATQGNDARAYELAKRISTLDADAILFADVINIDLDDEEDQTEALMRECARKRDRLAQFAFDFAEENSSPLMRLELIRLALALGVEDDEEGNTFRKMEALLGPLSFEQIDHYNLQGLAHLFHDPGYDMSPFVKGIFRRGGSEPYVRETAIALLEWDDERELASFTDLIQFLPDQ